ncbi:MAG: ABC transporter permease [bacterium]
MITYSPESPLLHPKRLLRSMCRDFWNSRDLSFQIFLRDFNAKYRQTLLGFLWAFLPPLLMTGIFVFLNRTNVVQSGPPGIPAPLFILTGMLFWQLFVDCLLNPTKVVEGSKGLVTKISLPVEGLILASVYQSLASFVVRLILLLGFCVWFRYIPGLLALPAIIFSIFPILVFGTCLGLVLMPLGLLYKDFAESVVLSTTVLLFITPVGYYVNASSDSIAWYFKVNPLMYLVNFPRDLFFRLSPAYYPVLLWILSAGMLVLCAGWILFKISLPIIFERLSA